MTPYLNIAQMMISIFLILAILFQVQGGGLGGIFGPPDTTYRSKRGIEKTLFQLTIVLVAVFILLSILSVRFLR